MSNRNFSRRRAARRASVPLLGMLPMLGCASVDPVGSQRNPLRDASQLPANAINWPPQYRPASAAFFVHNEIEIAAPPTIVWRALIEAENWPSWYPGAQNVSVTNDAEGRLSADSVFTWRTMDLNFTSAVREFEPPYRLSWESRRGVIQGYHVWQLIETPTGTRVVTEESQHGFLASMQRLFLKNKLRRLHDVWLANLKAKSEAAVAGADALHFEERSQCTP